jgi:hypothetical protein
VRGRIYHQNKSSTAFFYHQNLQRCVLLPPKNAALRLLPAKKRSAAFTTSKKTQRCVYYQQKNAALRFTTTKKRSAAFYYHQNCSNRDSRMLLLLWHYWHCVRADEAREHELMLAFGGPDGRLLHAHHAQQLV